MRGSGFTYSIGWNLFLLTLGSAIFSLGANALIIPHGLFSGGLFGAILIAYYAWGGFSPALAFFVLNIPLFILGWCKISHRFLLYSLYAMAVTSITLELIQVKFPIENQLYAAIAAGIICGGGCGIVLRSLGSGGGLDIVAVYLNRRYNLGIGRFYFIFNFILFCVSLLVLEPDLVIASLIMIFITAMTVDYVLALFFPAQDRLRGLGHDQGDRHRSHGEPAPGEHLSSRGGGLQRQGEERPHDGHRQYPTQEVGRDRLHHGPAGAVHRGEHLQRSRVKFFQAKDILRQNCPCRFEDSRLVPCETDTKKDQGEGNPIRPQSPCL